MPIVARTARPLLITTDPSVLDDVLRVAATVGVEMDVAAEIGAARALWSSAAAVVVGPDVVDRLVNARLPRRPHVVLVGDDLDDAGIWQIAVEAGAEHVLFLPDAEQWLGDMLADAAEPRGSAGGVIGVIGGRGGAGATTLAVALAVTATARGLPTLLVDGDPLGGGIDLVLGGEQARGLRWPDLDATRGRVPGPALAGALPRIGGLSVLSWDRGDASDVAPEAVDAVLEAARRAADLVVIDLPRHIDDGVRALASAADVMLLVVPCEVRAAAAAARVAARVRSICGDLRLVTRGPAPAKLQPADIAAALGLPLAGAMRAQPRLTEALERGAPPGSGRGPLAGLCADLLSDVMPTRWAA